MTRLVAAELAKLRSTRVLTVLTILVVAMLLALIGMQVTNAGKVGASSLGTADSFRALLGVVGVTTPIVLVVGVLLVTAEFRHATIATSLLVVPQRSRLLVAKAVTAALLGGAVAVGGMVLVLAVVVSYLAAAGVPVDLVSGDVALAVGGVLAAIPLYAVAGVGIGALIRHQTVAVVVPLVWLGVVEQLLPSYGLAGILRWLPGGATSALGRAEVAGLLPMWAGGLLLAVYVTALVVAGALRLGRVDLS